MARSPGNSSRLILVVEDTRTNMLLVKTTLERAGHRVVAACNADEARRQIEIESPDLILMDVQLPGQDGLSFTRELKTKPATAAIPIVAVTAHAMRGDEDKALAAGCSAYIAKPVNTRALPAQLDAILGQALEAANDS